MQQFWNEKYAPKCRLRDVLKVCTPDFFHHYLLGSAPLHFADSLLSYLIPSHSVLYCDILFNPATSYHIQYCTIILYSTLLYSTLLYSILSYPILNYSIPSYLLTRRNPDMRHPGWSSRWSSFLSLCSAVWCVMFRGWGGIFDTT